MTKEEYWEKYKNSDLLCIFFYNDFDIWWDTNRFDWKKSSWLLAKIFPDKFNIWWDPNKFVWIQYNHNKYIKHTDKYINNTNIICKYLLYNITIWYTYRKTDVDIINKYVNDLEWNYE